MGLFAIIGRFFFTRGGVAQEIKRIADHLQELRNAELAGGRLRRCEHCKATTGIRIMETVRHGLFLIDAQMRYVCACVGA